MFDDVGIIDATDEIVLLETQDVDEWESETFFIKNACLEIGPVSEESGPDASWKSMLLTQPPVKCMVVDTMGASHWHVLRAEKNAEGITVRQLQQFQAAFSNKWRTTVEIWAAGGFRLTPVAASAADILAEINDAVNVQEGEDAENWAIMSVADELFRVPELVAMILIQLPMLEILRLRTITRTCHDDVNVNPKLRIALFRKPYKDRQARLEDLERYFNVADCATQEDCDDSKGLRRPPREISQPRWVWGSSAQPCDIVVNPLIKFFNERTQDGTDPTPYVLRNMLLTQPPLATLLLEDFYSVHYHVLRPEEGTEGITILQLQRYLETFPNVVGEQDIETADGFVIMPVASTGAEIMAEIEEAMSLAGEQDEQMEENDEQEADEQEDDEQDDDEQEDDEQEGEPEG
ncbi:hypothetical protein CBER1_08271 [Cercospora berteroae]|uniref:F-box domain-containing protein n=1 Tax=Cercospora berteroae TaxID=357750 RepID=A0A2S6CEU5_9PEZI|nr:hypothetical protein CBER1_08271 [Cercospora berteroae]